MQTPAELAQFIVDYEFSSPQGRQMNRVELTQKYESMIAEYGRRQRVAAIDVAIEHFQNIPLDRMMPDPSSPKNSALIELREVRKELGRG